MNRLIFLSAAALPVLVDASLKSAALVVLAGLCALAMHRASAAARHVVWLVALLALLLVPVLSVVLPAWQVLPQWAAVERAKVTGPSLAVAPAPEMWATGHGDLPESDISAPAIPALPPSPFIPSTSPPSAPPLPAPVSTANSPLPPAPTAWLVIAWAAGCSVLLLRLAAAHFLLLRATYRCSAAPAGLSVALAAAMDEIGLKQPVRLLLDRGRTIPLVWGVFRPCLLLPAESVTWDAAQLRSVLLHETAHLRRRDPLVQCLMQLACALHWFNPLVWLAGWRLHVERERACDDLVLAKGVKPSVYAGHLLEIASQLTPTPWTAGCGLAMARKSSLEGRLLAVLSDRLDRRSVTRALTAAAILVGAAITIPVAMLQAQTTRKNSSPQAQKTMNLDTGDAPAAPAPQHKDARALYEIWQRHARLSGDIPGALIGELAAAVKVFIGYNPTWETVPKLNEILPRLDATHDWKADAAIALLDEVAAVQDSPLQAAAEKMTSAIIRKGKVLPEKYKNVAWGEVQRLTVETGHDETILGNGLRAAWVLEPSGVEHRIGEALTARLLVQNTGGAPIVVRVPTFHQGTVSATDAKGATVEVSGIEWTTLARLETVRLEMGEFIEIHTPGVGFGKDAGRGPWAGPRVGSNVLVNDGAELTLTHGPLALDGSGVGMREDAPHLIGPGWWLAHIKARLSRELPLPAGAAERKHLLDRAMRELFATEPTANQIAAFTADATPGALDALAKHLAGRSDAWEFSASLATAPVKFQVLPADPAADKTPRVVLGPGEYPLSETATLKIVGRPDGERYTYDTEIISKPSVELGIPVPEKIEVPGNWGTWAIVCRPDEGFFYILHKGAARKIGYTNPRQITDIPATDLPAEFRDEVKRQFDIAGVSADQQAEVFEKPAAPAATPEPETAAVEPKNEHARAHFALWQKYARANGDIPGGLVALLGKSILAGNDPKFPDLQRRCDGSRDWPAQEAADLLDALAATDNWSDDDGRLITIEHGDIAQHGKPLPPELASLPWGTADDSMVPISKSPTGLRTAFTLDPAAASYAQGTRLPVTIHYHNSGTAPVVFPIGLRSVDIAEARDEQGRNIFTSWVFPDGDNGRMKDGPWKAKHSVRLEPGHWISISGAQLTIPDGHYPFAKDAHGIVVMATPDSTVKLKWCAMTSTWRESQKGEVEWKERVQQSVDRFSPMPKSSADREGVIRRVTFALFGEEPTAADIAAFAADDSPEALAKLTARLQSLPPPVRYGGWLKTGEQTFKITPSPADYRGTVMSTNGPGLYEVAPSLYMHHGGAQVDFTFVPALDPPHPQLTFALKDQENLMVPHGIVWRHGSRVVWVAEKERVRKLDLTVPGKLTETELPEGLASIPDDLRAELVKMFPAIETAATPAQESSRSDKSRLQPQHEDAQALFKIWQAGARTDGKIPGGLIGQLARTTDDAVKQITDTEVSAKLAALRPRLDASRDWTQAEAVALLDDITAISAVPVSWADTAMRFPSMRMVRPGEPLPAELQSAAWGKPAANGLRAAWLLEPRAEQYALGTVLKARVLFHNSGTTPVVFETETWHQSDDHSARDGKGVEIPVNATWFTGITPMSKFRLAPGEFCEVMGHGIAIGAGEYADERSTGTVGAIIEAKEGDVVTLSHSVDAGTGGWTRPDDHWLVTIAGRVANEAPMPASAADREQLIRRVTLDILGVAPTAEEISAFTADNAPDALATLTARLQATPRVEPFIGKLPTGETKFRVLPADPNAATAPRSATAPGRYVLGDGVHLQVRQITENDQRRNSAEILFFGPDPTKQAPHEPHEIALPDGQNSYCFIWVRDSNTLMIVERGSVRTVDFSNPAAVQESRAKVNLSPEYKKLLPPGLLWKAGEKPADERPTTGTVKLTPDALLGAWSGTMNGKRLLISFHRPPVETEVQVDIYTGDATIGALAAFTIAPDGTSVALGIHDGKGGQVPFGTLHPIDANTMRLESRDKEGKAAASVVLTGGKGAPATEPEQKEARELFGIWKRTANADGTIPGTFIGMLATEVRAYVKANPNLDSAAMLPKLLPRFVTSRDWTQAEAIKLLDDVAYYATKPITARVAKAKLGSGPMWRTMVEFQDIPVAIAKWSEAKDGLRIGLRVVGGQWSAGGTVRVELWLHNPGDKDVSFRTAGPNRQDVEVGFSAIDAEGNEHWPEHNPLMLFAPLLDCTLPAGHVAMAKEFDVTFADADNDVRTTLGSRFRDLKPGKYQLRSVLWLAKPEPAKSEEHIILTAPDFGFTLGEAAVEADKAK